MAEVLVWVKFEDGKRCTSLAVANDTVIDQVVQHALTALNKETRCDCVSVKFEGNDITRDSIATRFWTTFDKPLLIICPNEGMYLFDNIQMV